MGEKRDGRRWYDDACGTAHALELVGERWSLLIVRELMFGPRRFGELRAALTGISANVLTQRLEGLEAAGILARRRLPPPASVQAYELTPWGYESETAIQELGRWAVRSPDHDPSLPLSAASLMLSFRTMVDRTRSGERPMTVGFRLGPEVFTARIDTEGIAVRRDASEAVEATFSGEPRGIAAVVYNGMPLAEAEAMGMLEVAGDRDLAERFATLFPLPPKSGGSGSPTERDS
ncbi:winged helix-turn-helix transcriptional regulator [Arenibaculum sp.]|jgi:DNA-binding HxlR family transcriptional regulator|uniref:winged helix-turn-helix transcriptional regulator n=1 Tax=Arenibaculum sp. TaxID=2865862 RepID=UPI002E0E619F|nr:winged helix-turn-helix transcriptional regulator [Arenibaculum sp.]